MRNVVLIAAIVSGAAAASKAADGLITTLPIHEGYNLRFDHLPLGVDPSHLRITSIVQDDLGFLWIGTDNGLKRYDGYRVRDYARDPKAPNRPSGNYVIALFKDRAGKIWVASGRSLDVYDPATEKFAPFRADPRSEARFVARVAEINQDRAGTIWLSTDKGLFGVGPEGVKVQYQHDAANDKSLSGGSVRSTLETRDGGFWVATDGGIDAIDRAGRKVERRIRFAMPHAPYSKLIEDHAGVIWLTYSAEGYPGLATVDRMANALRHYRVIPRGAKAYPSTKTLYEDADGNLWILTSQGGLFQLDRERTRFVRYRNDPNDSRSVVSDQLSAIFEDREGGVWLGTFSDGIDRFTRKPLPFRRYAQELRDPVNAVLRDSRGVLWIGTSRLLVKVDPQTGKLTHFRSTGPQPGGLSNSRIASLAEDLSGDLWIGTQGGGLNLLNVRSGRFQVYRHDKNDPSSLSNDAVSSLYLARSGVLWAGTENGLNSFDPRTKSFHVYPSPAKPSVYRRIAEDSRGHLWLSTGTSGLHRFDPGTGKFTVYRRSDAPGALSTDGVTGVCVDRSGMVWVGTNAGLYRLDPDTGRATVYNSEPPIRRIDSILEDARGHLWLGTDSGLTHFDTRAKTFRHYYTSDGLAANEMGGTAAWKSPGGEMYFGSQAGLTVFDPAQIIDDSTVPPVRLTEIQILGKPVAVGPESPLKQSISLTNSLQLTYAQNTVSLEFSALTFADPRRSRYRYRLEPIDKEWTEVDGARRWLTYAALPAGEYVLRVLGCNSRGVWNENGVRLAISVSPPWWNTVWFRTSVGAALLALLGALYGLRLRQVQRESKQLRDVVETIPAMAWTALPDGSNEFVNRRWAEFTGLSSEDTAGSGWTAVVHPEDRQPYLQKWSAAVATGNAVESEVRFRCAADGEYRWFLLRAVPLRDEHGRILRWYGILTDIDQRKRAEEALRRSEAYLADAQKLTHTGTFAADPTTAPLYWSEELFRMFGFDPQNGLPTREQPLERVHPEDLDKFRQAWHRAIDGKVDCDVEYRIILPDGTIRHIYGVGHPVLTQDGEVTEVVGTNVDITERKRAEEERERLRQLEADLAHINRVSMMGELAASIAHEVNQPLTGIVSNGGACLRWLGTDGPLAAPEADEIRQAVRDMVRDGKRAGEIIRHIRALTKRTELPRERLDLNETIRDVLALVGDEARKNGVTVRTKFADEVAPVRGDRVQLQQVLLNLLMNAIQAMSNITDREHQLVITTQNIDQDHVQVTVEDSGPGLAPDKIAGIFEPFYTTKSGGMGMGLSICRSILQNHSGRLWATANEGPGASFHFTIPKHQEENQNAGAAAD